VRRRPIGRGPAITLKVFRPSSHVSLGRILTVLRLVAAGDVSARRVVIDAGRAIGRALADLCNLLNPGMLVVGGELAAAGNSFTAGIREAIERYTQPAIAEAVAIRTSVLTDRADVLGAITLAIQTSPQRPRV
jgi:predicted NBD/HSP70 family sugar kinase